MFPKPTKKLQYNVDNVEAPESAPEVLEAPESAPEVLETPNQLAEESGRTEH